MTKSYANYTALALIIRQEKVLLLKKKGKWVLPGGRVKLSAQEGFETAARREANEETGVLCLDPGRVLGQRPNTVVKRNIVYVVFNESVGAAYNREPKKHEDVLWADPKKALKLLGDDLFTPVRDLLVHLKDSTLTPT